ncbi:MAG TPA: DinB family protein [Bryobacteraceae bacterium]|nr:DinB family protein [Bryobacteraceae bacterium]
MSKDEALREHLVELLEGGHAHITFKDAVKGFPVDQIGERPDGGPHSAWELLEHLRIAQNDILRFSQSGDYQSPKWPEGYWPAGPAPQKPEDWTKSLRAFRKDLTEFIGMIRDSKRDLYRRFPWGDGQTLLREAMMLADHNSYHLGQLVLVRKTLEAN